MHRPSHRPSQLADAIEQLADAISVTFVVVAELEAAGVALEAGGLGLRLSTELADGYNTSSHRFQIKHVASWRKRQSDPAVVAVIPLNRAPWWFSSTPRENLVESKCLLQSEPSLAAIKMLVLHRAPDSTEPYPRAEQLVQRMLFDYPKLPIETDVAELSSI